MAACKRQTHRKMHPIHLAIKEALLCMQDDILTHDFSAFMRVTAPNDASCTFLQIRTDQVAVFFAQRYCTVLR